MDELFGELRSMLARRAPTSALLSLLRRAHAQDPASYEQQWRPYLSAHLEHLELEVRGNVFGLDALALLPHHVTLGLFFNDVLPRRRGLSRLIHAPLERVSSLKVHGRTGGQHAPWLARVLSEPGWQRLERVCFSGFNEPAHALVDALLGSSLLPRLRALEVQSRCNLGRNGGARLLASEQFARLESLSLPANELSTPAMLALEHSDRLTTLRRLDLSGNVLRGAPMTALARAQLPALESLRLSSCSLIESDAPALSRAPWLTGLKSLNLQACSLEGGLASVLNPRDMALEELDLRMSNSREPFEFLWSVPWREQLTTLRLSARLTPQDVRRLGDMPRLEHLTLSLVLGPRALEALASVALPGLKTLDLRMARTDLASVRALSRSSSFQALESLDLSNASLDDAQVLEIARATSFPRLRSLKLSYNQCSEGSSLRALVGSETLPRGLEVVFSSPSVSTQVVTVGDVA